MLKSEWINIYPYIYIYLSIYHFERIQAKMVKTVKYKMSPLFKTILHELFIYTTCDNDFTFHILFIVISFNTSI